MLGYVRLWSVALPGTGSGKRAVEDRRGKVYALSDDCRLGPVREGDAAGRYARSVGMVVLAGRRMLARMAAGVLGASMIVRWRQRGRSSMEPHAELTKRKPNQREHHEQS